jgi:hypothetical protein
MKFHLLILCLLTCGIISSLGPSRGASHSSRLPAPSIKLQGDSVKLQLELEKAASIGRADPFAGDLALRPFRVLHHRYPNEILVDESYQDAVQRHGVEGHLKSLTEEYRILDAQHSGSQIYHYLYLRSLVGYSTRAAIQGLTEMAALDPGFAPAHLSLAGIYGSRAFHDAAKEKLEREKLNVLCPGTVPPMLPQAMPAPSLLLDLAERLNTQHGDPDRILALTTEGISQEECRWQHIHPRDWYSPEEKRKTLQDLRASYWKAWTIQVRCCRRAGQSEKADNLLARMDSSSESFRTDPGPQYWASLATLVQLYAEQNQRDQAALKLDLMSAYLAANPDRIRDAQLMALKALITP